MNTAADAAVALRLARGIERRNVQMRLRRASGDAGEAGLPRSREMVSDTTFLGPGDGVPPELSLHRVAFVAGVPTLDVVAHMDIIASSAAELQRHKMLCYRETSIIVGRTCAAPS